jgi:hypothetical protein
LVISTNTVASLPASKSPNRNLILGRCASIEIKSEKDRQTDKQTGRDGSREKEG